MSWKNYSCEICLAEYPKYIKYKSNIYYIVDLTCDFEQYVIFDYNMYDDIKRIYTRKGYFIIKLLDNTEITLVYILR